MDEQEMCLLDSGRADAAGYGVGRKYSSVAKRRTSRAGGQACISL